MPVVVGASVVVGPAPLLVGAAVLEPVAAVVLEVSSVLVAVALNLEHWAAPADCAWIRSEGWVQALSKQGAAAAPMAVWVGPHWHATSVAAQPAALMAEIRQSVCFDVEKTISFSKFPVENGGDSRDCNW